MTSRDDAGLGSRSGAITPDYIYTLDTALCPRTRTPGPAASWLLARLLALPQRSSTGPNRTRRSGAASTSRMSCGQSTAATWPSTDGPWADHDWLYPGIHKLSQPGRSLALTHVHSTSCGPWLVRTANRLHACGSCCAGPASQLHALPCGFEYFLPHLRFPACSSKPPPA